MWFLVVDFGLLASSGALAPAFTLGSSGTPVLATGYSVLGSGYLLGGPIVHWSHGHLGRGFASLGLRIGAPLALGLVGWPVGRVADLGCDATIAGGMCTGAFAGLVTGLALGYVGAVVLDASLLARETVTLDGAERAHDAPKLEWRPTAGYDPRRGLFTMGVGGTF